MGHTESMAPKATARRTRGNQHDPSPEERDERVSLAPHSPEEVIRTLLQVAPKNPETDAGKPQGPRDR